MSYVRKEFTNAIVPITVESITNAWEEKVKTTLDEYMTIPNVSPAYASDWKEQGHIARVVDLFSEWAHTYAPSTARVNVQHIEDKTPLIVIEIDAQNYEGDDTILMYGHLDKQPPMTGWNDGIEPFGATYVEGKLYGRGGADDGYAMFSAVLAILELEKNNIPHARIVVVIEASEESGSPDLPAHLDILDATLTNPLGEVSFVVCLDSGCLDYRRWWITQSLRGLLQVNVTVKVLEQGTHSGGAGGIVPSATHILRALLDRICEPGSGRILLPELFTEIPQSIRESAQLSGELLGSVAAHGLPFAQGVHPLHESVGDQILANTYEPALEIIGIEGIPTVSEAGNVLRPEVTLALSFRLPPGVDPQIAAAAVTEELVRDTPYGAQVAVVIDSLAAGWAAPECAAWLRDAFDATSEHFFAEPALFMGEGGTIPFMAMLGEKYPDAQFAITGVLGPESNAHGPNEFLDIAYAQHITACVSAVLAAHAMR